MRKRVAELAFVVAVVAIVAAFAPWKQASSSGESATTSSHNGWAMNTADAPVPVTTLVTPMTTSPWMPLFEDALKLLGQGDNQAAKTKLLGALEAAEAEGNFPAFPTILEHLSLACLGLGEMEESLAYQARAIEVLRSQDAASKDWSTDGALQGRIGLYEGQYASILGSLSRQDEALEALARARVAVENAYPAGSPAYSQAINNLAAQHRALGDNDGAARLVEES